MTEPQIHYLERFLMVPGTIVPMAEAIAQYPQRTGNTYGIIDAALAAGQRVVDLIRAGIRSLLSGGNPSTTSFSSRRAAPAPIASLFPEADLRTGFLAEHLQRLVPATGPPDYRGG